MVFPAGTLAGNVYANANQWAPPIAWCGLALIPLTTLAYLWIRRHGWLLIAPAAFGGWLGFALALLNNWEMQLSIALTVGTFAYLIGVIAYVYASTRFTLRTANKLESITRDIGEEMKQDAPFRDDGERITVYASRPRLLLRTLPQIGFLVALAFAWRWVHANALSSAGAIVFSVLIALCACVFGLLLVLTIIRFMMDSPTLIITASGIADNGSQIVMGQGLLRWDEIIGVLENTRSFAGITTWRNLWIMVTDARAITERQPRWKRAFALVFSGRVLGGFLLWRALLDRPVAELVADIEDYIRRHAPSDSYHAAVSGAADGSEDLDAQNPVQG
jgi:hypothetical protein